MTHHCAYIHFGDWCANGWISERQHEVAKRLLRLFEWDEDDQVDEAGIAAALSYVPENIREPFETWIRAQCEEAFGGFRRLGQACQPAEPKREWEIGAFVLTAALDCMAAHFGLAVIDG